MPVRFLEPVDSRRSPSVGYYRVSVSDTENHERNDLADHEHRLIVNCTGSVDLQSKFITSERLGRQDYYLLYMNGGSMDAIIDGKPVQFIPGDVVLIPPGVSYSYTKSSTDNVRYLWVHFTGYDAKSMLERCGFTGFGVHHIGFDESIAALFMAIMEEFIRRDDYYEEAAAAKVTEIVIALRRKLEQLASAESSSMTRIFASIKYIHENFKTPITNETLASIEHLSVSQYIELFRRCTGATPRSYVIELRIRSACELLRTSDLTVAQIADSVGYDDAHYFSRIFKTHRGVSPDVYRKQATK
ncbi:MAG: helix-turn-helix domain-containing protein [Ruminococcaceae bacterium]|nr:helix-turn-helix domain-containing protein [Oscillospiraceae bacterium]